MAKVVWILGAGFSMPLGAPSFRQLISKSMVSLIHHRFERPWAHRVLKVYEQGQLLQERRDATPKENDLDLWRDPEEFLEKMEEACQDPSSALSALMDHSFPNLSLGDIRREAIRFCAAACSHFLEPLEKVDDARQMIMGLERWSPYVTWKRRLLKKEDTVITFNWDRVLNMLGGFGGPELVDVEPGVSCNPGWDESVVAVYHLHGHVDWKRVPDSDGGPDKISATGTPGFAIKNPQEAAIAVPGTGKQADAEGPLNDLWKKALAKLTKAEHVVFIGYRFPPSDNYSKRWLTEALKKSGANSFHVVLGPASPDEKRMKQLLSWCSGKSSAKEINIHQMGAEDFLQVVERRHITGEEQAS